MKIAAAAVLLAASLAVPATAHADDPVPTVDRVVDILQELSDPDKPAADKSDIVIPGFSPDEAGMIDDHLNRMRRQLPPDFVVTDIQPASNNLAGATVETRHTYARPIVLVDQGGRWLITHDTAMTELDAFWRAANRPGYVPGFAL
jgi:hypothetical protein